MPSNLDLLREGKAIEFRPGLQGMLDKEKKTLMLSNGLVLDVADDKDYFPETGQDLALSKQRDYAERGAKGGFGEFMHQYTTQGIAGGINDWRSFLTQTGEDYANQKRAERETSSRISKESPWTSGAATAANIATDLALTRGMSGVQAAPLLTLGSAGSRIATEPGEVLGETALSAAAGYGLDKVGGYFSRVAKRRAEIQSLPGRQQAVKASNALEKEAIEEANALKSQKFLSDQDKVKNLNKYKTQQNKYDYEKALNELPAKQAQLQSQYSADVIKSVEQISNAFPNEAKIVSKQLGLKPFLDETIPRLGLAGTKEGAQATKILQSIVPEGEILTAKDLVGRYRAIEASIQRATPEVREVLNQFKTHMGSKLTPILADNISYNRVMPTLKKQIEKEIQSALKSMPLAETGVGSRSYLMNRAKSNLNGIMREITPEEFVKKLQSGEIRERILKRVMNPDDFSINLGFARPGKKTAMLSSSEAERLGIDLTHPGQQRYDQFSSFFSPKLDKVISKAEIKTLGSDIDASRKIGTKVRNTEGVAGSLPTPVPTQPSLLPEPVAPPPRVFTPTPEPALTPAQDMAESTGDFLQKNLMGGRSLVDNPVTKLAGLKYVLGKAALPIEAGYLALKGLTSPGTAGEVARQTFKQAGIQAIEVWAQKYPSYENGILHNPQERRSLTKEIEDDPEIPIEQKAIMQSKVNRGKPLNSRL